MKILPTALKLAKWMACRLSSPRSDSSVEHLAQFWPEVSPPYSLRAARTEGVFGQASVF